MRKVRTVTDRTVNYDALLARESESRERLAKARYELDNMVGNGVIDIGRLKQLLGKEGAV